MVPVRTLHAAPSPKVLRVQARHHLAERTPRDSLFILDTLLNLDGGVRPEMVTTDTGSLITNQVRAYDLLCMFRRERHPTPLGQAFAEYGQIDKTLHLLALVDPVDDTYRRTANPQLTVQESRHTLARSICHGRRSTIAQPYRDGQEDQLASLGLVLNAVILWNTRYLDAAVATLRAAGHQIADEDVARLSPVMAAHINTLGRYAFIPTQPERGLQPLRAPATSDMVEDWQVGAV